MSEKDTGKEKKEQGNILENKWFILIVFLALAFIVFHTRYISYEGKISHGFPMTINAGDPNSRLSEAEWIGESEKYDTEPPWFYTKNGIAQHYAPILVIIPAAVSQITGIPVHDSFFFIGVLVALGITICFYILFRRFFENNTAALILAVLISFPYEYFYHYQLNIGMYGNYFTALFYPLALIFLMNYIKDKRIISMISLVAIYVL